MNNLQLKTLNLKIYYLKQYLYTLIDKHDLSNAEVIQCSKELDELIVEYENKNIKIYTNKTTTDLSVVSFLIDKFYYFIYIYIFTFFIKTTINSFTPLSTASS